MKYAIFLFYFSMSLTYISCGQATDFSRPLKEFLNTNNKTNVTKYLNEKKWNNLFPHRYGIGLIDSFSHNPDFYSFKAFVTASKIFPLFLSEGDETIQKRELAAFLANIAQETSGGWETAQGGYFKWGLYFLEEKNIDKNNFYNDTSKKNYPAADGKYYYGRGPKQLSWDYNYAQFSQAWFGHADFIATSRIIINRSCSFFRLSHLVLDDASIPKAIVPRYNDRKMDSHNQRYIERENARIWRNGQCH